MNRVLISLTQRARQQFSKIAKDNKTQYIRLAVVSGGCNGHVYQIKPDKAVLKKDYLEKIGTECVVLLDPKTQLKLAGSSIDFIEDDLQEKFLFDNPQAKSVCACGVSWGETP